MSVSQNMVFFEDAAEFTFAVGERIAKEVALGSSLHELHEAYPDVVPNPIIVKRWRERIVAFDMLMGEVEAAKAERLADETIIIADDPDRQAAQANNAIKSRQWLASKLNERYGSTVEKGKGSELNLNVILTDSQLMQIAAGGLDAIEGESRRLVGAGDTDDTEVVVRDTVDEAQDAPQDAPDVGAALESGVGDNSRDAEVVDGAGVGEESSESECLWLPAGW